MTDIVLLFSGGLDSTVLLAQAPKEGKDVLCLSFRYGAKHEDAEMQAAWQLAVHYGVPRVTVDLRAAFSAMANGGVAGQDYVPARNSLFIAVAAGLAETRGIPEVWMGAHRDDRAGFPDCRPEYIAAADVAMRLGTASGVRVVAPFVEWPKSAVVRRGVELSVPLELTHTCYQGVRPGCGECGACRTRARAFHRALKIDPLATTSRARVAV